MLDHSNAGGRTIGTLTGWQLLSEGVGSIDEEDEDDFHGSGSHAFGRRSSNNDTTSSDSSEAPSTSSNAGVATRPHQWLYKEYKILEEIGKGGFGSVYRAIRLADGQLVVVKTIKMAALSAKQRRATMDEVEVLAKLDHPNIVKYHDCFTDTATINIVMEYCDAGDLASFIKSRQGVLLPEDEVMRKFVQICLAIQYVHYRGVLHRDLKTSNVMCTSSGLLKLVDFGVSKINNTEASMANTIVGTPHYLSPEMCDNKPYGKKSDVWALGCILCELCTLSKAFESSSISKIILMIMSGQFTRLPDCYSPQLRQLVDQLLSVKTEGRPYVDEVLQQPFVRGHLDSYLEWCKDVPGAQSTAACLTTIEAAKRSSAVGAALDSGRRWSVDVPPAAMARAASQAPAGPQGGGATAVAKPQKQQQQQPLHQQQQQPSEHPQQPASHAPQLQEQQLSAGGRQLSGESPGALQGPYQQQQQQQQQGPARSTSGLQLLIQEQLHGMQKLQQLKANLGLAAGFGAKVVVAPSAAARQAMRA